MTIHEVKTDNEIADFAYEEALSGSSEHTADAPACIDQLHGTAWKIWADAFNDGLSDAASFAAEAADCFQC